MNNKSNSTQDNDYIKEPIAIIGMGSVFPEAKNLLEYWNNIIHKKDCISDIPQEYWDTEDFFSSDVRARDKTYSKRAGVIPDIDFDPMEFGIPPNVLESISITQLLSLVIARDTFKDAGYLNEKEFNKEKTGVILGAAIGGTAFPLSTRIGVPPVLKKILKASGVPEEQIEIVLEKLLNTSKEWSEDSFPGFLANIVSGRICNRFDLGGLNCTVDAACASSLAAVKMAINELRVRDCDMVLTGGVNVNLSAFSFLCFSKTPALSPENKSRPYDTKSDGMVLGDGIGMLLLKRLSDAERDGDNIYAVIKDIGVSSDGRSKSIYAPKTEGQVTALSRAYEGANCSPASIGLVEGHGTGTVVGDLSEINCMKSIFNGLGIEEQSIALGSVKSQIGHTRMAAGIAGIIKASMALHEKILPPMINIDIPNPKFNLENSPFYLSTETYPWFTGNKSTKRRAAVSAFGFGGSNFHIILEEYKQLKTQSKELCNSAAVIIIADDDVEGLGTKCKKLINTLLGSPDKLPTLLYELQNIDINHKMARVGFVAKTSDEVIKYLYNITTQFDTKPEKTEWNLPQGIYYRSEGLKENEKVAAVFSGQGSQYPFMGIESAKNVPSIMNNFEHMDSSLKKKGYSPITDIVFPKSPRSKEKDDKYTELLKLTTNAQPAIGAYSFGLYEYARNLGFSADCYLGHSFGEITALLAAGAYTDEVYREIVVSRGIALSEKGDQKGGMVAVNTDEESLNEILSEYKDVKIANYNSESQFVLSGSLKDIEDINVKLGENHITGTMLPVSNAFHTKYMEKAKQKFKESIASLKIEGSMNTVISNSTAERYPTNAKNIKDFIVNQITSPVRFVDSIKNSYKSGCKLFVEFGPKRILTNLIDDILKDEPHYCISLNSTSKKDDYIQLLQANAQLRVFGVIGNKDAIQPPSRERVILEKKKSKLNIKLNGLEYVSEKTNDLIKKQYEKSTILKDLSENKSVKSSQAFDEHTKEAIGDNHMNEINVKDSDEHIINAPIDSIIKNQELNTRAQIEFIKMQSNQSGVVNNLVQQQVSMLKRPKGEVLTESVIENLSGLLARMEANNDMCISLHNDYINNQFSYFEGLPKSTSKSVANNIPDILDDVVLENSFVKQKIEETNSIYNKLTIQHVSQKNIDTDKMTLPVIDEEEVAGRIINIVSEKTGYPEDMLELDMDMEADLGIDSIKRVEIFSKLQDFAPTNTDDDDDDAMIKEMGLISEIKTLDGIVKYVIDKIKTNQNTYISSNIKSIDAPAVQKSSQINVKEVEKNILQIVSEKTGYPEDMLELDMDMEADLGIDSIKRVEIFSKLQDFAPTNTDDADDEAMIKEMGLISEIKTLGGIVKYVIDKIKTNQNTYISSNIKSIDAPAVQKSSQINVKEVEKNILQIVSEKTGYPEDMLELDMDMEADLGIDSIKRVEIFSKLQDFAPTNTDDADDEAMIKEMGLISEIKTLGGIVKYVIDKIKTNQNTYISSNIKSIDALAVQKSSQRNVKELEKNILHIVSEKTGYPEDMLELDMDMEADLGIDSIKRVEIFSKFQEFSPGGIDSVDEESMINEMGLISEIKTLGEIVVYLSKKIFNSNDIAVTQDKIKIPVFDKNTVGCTIFFESISLVSGFPENIIRPDMGLRNELGMDSVNISKIIDSFESLSKQKEVCFAVKDRSTSEYSQFENVFDLYSHIKEIYPNLFHNGKFQSQIIEKDTYSQESIKRYIVSNISKKIEGYIDPGNLCSEYKWIIASNDSEIDNTVVDLLKDLGISVIRIFLDPEKKIKERENLYILPSNKEKDIKSLVDSLKQSYENIGGFIYLHSAKEIDKVQNIILDYEIGSIKSIFFLLKKLKQEFDINEGIEKRKPLIVLTQFDGFLASSSEKSYAIVNTALYGLLKSLNREWKGNYCRIIDLYPGLSKSKVKNIIKSELLDKNEKTVEVGLDSNGNRITVGLVERLEGNKNDFYLNGKNTVALVTGGARGITSKCIIGLASKSHSIYVLIGRTTLEEESWSEKFSDENELKTIIRKQLEKKNKRVTPVSIDKLYKSICAKREIKETLEAIDAAGGRGVYYPLDVCDENAIKVMLRDISEKYGNVTTFIHGAGVISDKKFEKKTENDFNIVFNTKILGLRNIINNIDHSKLQTLVVFSSIASYFGNAGQTDYAAANEVLNKYVYNYKKFNPECNSMSINWGPWDSGMVSNDLKKMYAALNMEVIPIDTGVDFFLKELELCHKEEKQILICGKNLVEEMKTN